MLKLAVQRDDEFWLEVERIRRKTQKSDGKGEGSCPQLPTEEEACGLPKTGCGS
jgi:hypothetical protein